MPSTPIPPQVEAILRNPNPCVIATMRPDGELHTAATWYLWTDDDTVLVNMDASRRRLEHMRLDPRVALTMFVGVDWYRHISLIGRVKEIRPDPGLQVIDRMSEYYTGKPFSDRVHDRFTAEIEIDRWHGWADAGPVQP